MYNGVDKIFTARCYHYTIVFSYKLTTYYITMPRMIEVDDILIRIADRGKLEYSRNDGRSWTPLYNGSTAGEFIDLVYNDEDDEIIAATTKGICYSRSGGRSWTIRYTSSRIEFDSLRFSGNELLAQTSDGLYYSRNAGRAWTFRHR